ncbi:hypothetical protein DV736_g4540, partial [Chaetothyriales sp. CBS 134916]
MDLSAGIIPFTSVTASEPVDLAAAIPSDNLSSRTVLITGGASGLGAATALSLASHGANIIIGDLASQATRAAELVTKLRKVSGHENHHFVAADVLSWSSQMALFQTAASLSPHGGIDCVMANAGICDGAEALRFANPPAPSSLADTSTVPPPALKTVEVNLTGVLYTTHLALSYLPANPASKPTFATPDAAALYGSQARGGGAVPGAAADGGANARDPREHAMAHIEDVAEAATRLVADNGIVGRGLEIGVRGKRGGEQNRAAGLEPAAGNAGEEEDGDDYGRQKGHQAVWDVYAHDFEQSDIFTRRVIAVTNIVATARGWTGIVFDIAARLVSSLRSLVGR